MVARLARYDIDSDPISDERWRELRADEAYGVLVDTTLLAPALPAPRRVMIRTRWVGVDMRPPSLAWDGDPAIWLTTVTGGVLDGRVASVTSRAAAHHEHDRAIGDVQRAAAALEEMHAAGSCAITQEAM